MHNRCLVLLLTVEHQDDLVLTFTFRLSAVVSSNCSPSLKEISVFFRELSVLMFTMAPSALIMILGFANPARFRSVSLTPVRQKKHHTFLSHLGRSAKIILESNLKRARTSPPLKFWIMGRNFFNPLGASWIKPDPANLKACLVIILDI